MADWNYGDLFDATARALPFDRPAVIFEDRVIPWSEFDKRTNNLARALIKRGLKPREGVAFYHRNGIEYVELIAATAKARLAHVNINYRYRDEELLYILEDSKAAAVSFDREFLPVIERLRPKAKGVRLWIEAGSAAAPLAEAHEALVAEGNGGPLDIQRAPDDITMIYTGGTTGMPKGVLWRHDVLRTGQVAALAAVIPAANTMEEHTKSIAETAEVKPMIIAPPLMHGTGFTGAMGQMCNGQPIVLLDSSKGFDAARLWQAAAKHKVVQIAIVGDAFAKPMASALEAMTPKADLSAMTFIISSGAMWSRETKARLIAEIPQLITVDVFAASESLHFGASLAMKDNIGQTAKVMLSPNAKILKECGNEAKPGESGLIAVRDTIAVGYFGDEEKTKKTYREIDGVRWCLPGDWAKIEEDGSVTLLGRGSNCINTAGEKVFPEEVEEVLKLADGVRDALVVGVPDERWGNAVVAVVTADADGDEQILREFVGARLARYKAPKRIFFTRDVLRLANGKADYKSAREIAMSGRSA